MEVAVLKGLGIKEVSNVLQKFFTNKSRRG
jgi:hypothetical protein